MYGPNRSRRLRRGDTNTQKNCTKKNLHDPDNHDGIIPHTHLESDILECEVKWALGSITMNKAKVGDGILVELFQILKDDAVKSAALNMLANLENSAVATGLKRSVSLQSQRRGMPKNIYTTAQVHSFHMLASSCSKSFTVGFNST